MAHDPNNVDYSSDEWARGYEDAILGRPFDQTYDDDDSYTEGFIMGDAEMGSADSSAARGDFVDSTGAAWQWAVGPIGAIMLAQIDGDTRLWVPNEAVAEAATRIPRGQLPRQ